MKVYVTVLFSFSFHFIFAQFSKPPIDTSVFKKWSSVSNGSMTGDGQYFLYNIENDPIGSNTLVIKSVKGSWEMKFPGAVDGRFAENNQIVLFRRLDSLCIYNVRRESTKWIPGVRSYKIFGTRNDEYVVYNLNNVESSLIFENLGSGIRHEFYSVNDFRLLKDGRTILINRFPKDNNLARQTLDEVTTNRFTLKNIWSTSDSTLKIKLNSIALDSNYSQIAFVVKNKDHNAIWLFMADSNRSACLVNDSIRLDDNVYVEDIRDPGFSYDGTRLFINLQEETVIEPKKPTNVNVDIWSYKDAKLQSQQLYDLEHASPTQEAGTAVVNIPNGQITRLSFDNEDITIFRGNRDIPGFLARYGKGYNTERNWNLSSRDSFYLVSTVTGKGKEVNCLFRDISSGGNYLYGFDSEYQFVYVYDILTGLKLNISKMFPKARRFDEDYDKPGPILAGLSVAGWMSGDSAVLIYDKYDIWKVNLKGEHRVINVTGGYGRIHHLVLRLIGNYGRETPIVDGATYILSAYNDLTKQRGFASWSIKEHQIPTVLSMRSNSCEVQDNRASLDVNWLMDNKLAATLVKCESAARSPNYFVTADFRTFDSLSAVYPEVKYNWLISEVIHWQDADGSEQTGVLYKPENFDPMKKYPVLIKYYEKLSQHANDYRRPAYAIDDINIPWFVSRGYIVFTPDISYKIGYPLYSAYKSIVSGAKHLMKFPWVDSKGIALEGHSWGAAETNYVITHSNLFCAALSACGVSDFISGYGSLMDNGIVLQWFYEIDQSRIGSTPWERPDLYVENSAVLKADRVITPLLMMNNKDDAVVPFSQGVEFFTALRRLGKKVWLLQYDGEKHSLSSSTAVDYTMRMTQFFDYYCKHAAAPKWMINGIPARLKGTDNGLELGSADGRP